MWQSALLFSFDRKMPLVENFIQSRVKPDFLPFWGFMQ
jgi:hypothetical protein